LRVNSKDAVTITTTPQTIGPAEDLGMSGARTMAKCIGVSTFESPWRGRK
jgi:hypothetical protein